MNDQASLRELFETLIAALPDDPEAAPPEKLVCNYCGVEIKRGEQYQRIWDSSQSPSKVIHMGPCPR